MTLIQWISMLVVLLGDWCSQKGGGGQRRGGCQMNPWTSECLGNFGISNICEKNALQFQVTRISDEIRMLFGNSKVKGNYNPVETHKTN